MESIDVTALKDKLTADPSVVLIDVRTGMEFATGHVPEAKSVPLSTVGSQVGELKGKGTVYVICQSGNRSQAACQQLSSAGISVVNVSGGTSAWISSGFEVKREKSLTVLLMPLAASLTLGLAPFSPEPHLVGKIRWVMGGAHDMGAMDWFDLVLHGGPWVWLAWAVVAYLRTPAD